MRGLLRIFARPGEQRLKPVEPALLGILGRETCSISQLLNDRIESRIGIVRRALVANQELGSADTSSTSASVMRDFPIPASPVNNTAWPSPLWPGATARTDSPSSWSRPTMGAVVAP